MSSENGHMPDGYYVVRKESGRKVLYSPEKIPIYDSSVGTMVNGTQPRPVASWTTPIGNAQIHHIASLDTDVMEKRVGSSMALMELREMFEA